MNYHMLRGLAVIFSLTSLSWILFSCQDELLDRVVVYSNDFSGWDDQNIRNFKLHEFNGDTLLGWYHNEEVSITLSDLPAHNTVEISLDLLIHDSWDGNPENMGGPDFWYLRMDDEEIIHTTFSNTPCGFSFCLYQAYPENFPRTFEPKSGAVETDLPGRCQYNGIPGWTSRYRITRLVKHNSRNLSLILGDKLVQLNAPDPTCDESWSLSKIEVKTLTVK